MSTLLVADQHRHDATHRVEPFVERLCSDCRPSLLILCDHAGFELPQGVEELEITEDLLRRHIGWDIGAAVATRRLHQRLGGTALLNHASRLYVDANRRPFSPTSIPASSDGIFVPGNRSLSKAARARRHAIAFWPYHRRISRLLGGISRQGLGPVLISVHSFTPVMAGVARPWDVGVLWDHDRRLAGRVLRSLRARDDLMVGDNEPYSGLEEFGFTVTFHAQRTGIPHIMFELRQDRVESDEQARLFGDILADSVEPLLDDPDLRKRMPETNRKWRRGPLV
ncbi:MAG: N-formylglutamate amidohydrolase [Geminicoccaceae bacterium]